MQPISNLLNVFRNQHIALISFFKLQVSCYIDGHQTFTFKHKLFIKTDFFKKSLKFYIVMEY